MFLLIAKVYLALAQFIFASVSGLLALAQFGLLALAQFIFASVSGLLALV
jgi:hypothetical protein